MKKKLSSRIKKNQDDFNEKFKEKKIKPPQKNVKQYKEDRQKKWGKWVAKF